MMYTNILAAADLHIRHSPPVYRIDNYWETIQEKLVWIVETANKNKAVICISGDTFDTPRVSHRVVNKVIDIFRKAKNPVIMIPGNHDLVYHSTDLELTPLMTLAKAGVITLLHNTVDKNSSIYGLGWEGKYIPKEDVDILLIHKCVTLSTPPFFLKDAISAQDLLNMYPQFKYIISGDYHTPFIFETDKGTVINPGTIMRNKIDQVNHKPCVYLMIKDNIHRIEIPHKKFEEVFDTKLIECDTKMSSDIGLTELIKAISSKQNKPDFKKILIAITKKEKVTSSVRTILQDIILKIYTQKEI